MSYVSNLWRARNAGYAAKRHTPCGRAYPPWRIRRGKQKAGRIGKANSPAHAARTGLGR